MPPRKEGQAVLSPQPVEVTDIVRRMRGHSQAFLVRGSDGGHYVCKFMGNPQGNRSLVNEWIAGRLLSVLGVATPELTALRLGNICQERERLYFSDHDQRITSGLHLGSRCPVDVNTTVIFDFLPGRLYAQVSNLKDIGVVFAFDHWVAQCDYRQFIFARQKDLSTLSVPKLSRPFTAWAIDHGMCFGGRDRLLSTTQTLCPSRVPHDIYLHCNLKEAAAEGAQLVESLTASELHAATQDIPREWFGPGDETALNTMLQKLQERQQDLTASISKHVAGFMVPQKLAS